ncbi:flagellar hook-length control protein FliK [Devosia chinhatensis]|nr:flagellar hook-length control protein FliK [Devosia chinhatensis]
MSIASQLPSIPLAQASVTLRALAQSAAGSTLQAQVIGQLENGSTQVQIGRQTLALHLPMPQAPGTMLTLALNQADGQVKMTLISAQPPMTGTPQNPVPPPTSPAATSVQLSPAALAQPSAPLGIPTSPTVATGAGGAQSGASIPVSPRPAASTAGLQTPASSPGLAASGAEGLVRAAPISVASINAAERSMPVGPAGTAPAAPMAGAAVSGRPTIPYAVAAPAAAILPVQLATTTTPPALPPVAQASGVIASGAQSGQVPSGAQGQSAGAAAPMAPPAVQPSSPQVALTQMVQQALVRQDSVLGLTVALSQVVGRVAMPEPVVKAAQQVLGQRLALDEGGVTPSALARAIRNSGIFQEAMLGAGLAKSAGGDMKTALLGLQRQLGAWLGDQMPMEQVRTIPPPLRGMTPRARSLDLPMGEIPYEPHQAGKALLERTEAALSRLRLHQAASLPEAASRQEAQWSLDLPVMVAGQQSLLHLHIHRDRDAMGDAPEDRGWQVKFAINFSDMGEVGAQVSLRAGIAGVLLWAERPETAQQLDAEIAALRHELEALGLKAGAIVVRAGVPAPDAPVPSGNIVDERR